MLYPFTFKPILKKVIWGGSAICPFKGITPVENGVGESWELSHVEGNYSVVANGELEGKSLDDLIQSYGCLLYTSPSPRDLVVSRMPSSA